MIRVACPKCNNVLFISDELLGSQGECPGCYHQFPIMKQDSGEALLPQQAKPLKALRSRQPRRDDSYAGERQRRPGKEVDPQPGTGDRPRSKSTTTIPRMPSLSAFTIVLITMLALSLLFGLFGILVPALIFVPLAIGFTGAFIGSIWFLLVAFADDVWQGLACFLVPFYSWFYLASHWQEEKKPFLLGVVGLASALVGLFPAGATGSLGKR